VAPWIGAWVAALTTVPVTVAPLQTGMRLKSALVVWSALTVTFIDWVQ
jgi:hypothetical protein